jgi:hypothetical protein
VLGVAMTLGNLVGAVDTIAALKRGVRDIGRSI